MLRKLVAALCCACFAMLAAPDDALARECMASWYGPGFYDNLTASGEVYTGEAGTAAHPTLPFGTELAVTNLNPYSRHYLMTERVVVNDRGPYAADRCLDVSRGSAWIVDRSVALVRIRIIDPESRRQADDRGENRPRDSRRDRRR